MTSVTKLRNISTETCDYCTLALGFLLLLSDVAPISLGAAALFILLHGDARSVERDHNLKCWDNSLWSGLRLIPKLVWIMLVLFT